MASDLENNVTEERQPMSLYAIMAYCARNYLSVSFTQATEAVTEVVISGRSPTGEALSMLLAATGAQLQADERGLVIVLAQALQMFRLKHWLSINLEPLEGEVMDGEIVEGSAVKTLHFKQAVYGRVMSLTGGMALVWGRTQPGKPTEKFKASVENLDLIPEEELAPEDRTGQPGSPGDAGLAEHMAQAGAIAVTPIREYVPEEPGDVAARFDRALESAQRGKHVEREPGDATTRLRGDVESLRDDKQ